VIDGLAIHTLVSLLTNAFLIGVWTTVICRRIRERKGKYADRRGCISEWCLTCAFDHCSVQTKPRSKLPFGAVCCNEWTSRAEADDYVSKIRNGKIKMDNN